MDLIYKEDCKDIDWIKVQDLLRRVGMSIVDVEKHRISFENSYAVVFVFDNEKMIGFGRSISDGVRQTALYDIAIEPDYQGKGIGKKIVNLLQTKSPDCNYILYASPGKESFYRNIGFRKMKTGMILFSDFKRMEDGIFTD